MLSPVVWMLTGLPGSGKSTWAENKSIEEIADVLSSDYFIEEFARNTHSTYNTVFKEVYKRLAEPLMYTGISSCVSGHLPFIWDQTNLTKATRIKKLMGQIPDYYTKIAVYMDTPLQVCLERNREREDGRKIDEKIIIDMMNKLEMPSSDEGFDYVEIIAGVH